MSGNILPNRPTVILMDASPECRQATVALVQNYGYECVTFDTADATVRAVSQAKSPLVVADLRFATEILQQMRELELDAPVIAIAADSEPTKQKAVLAEGATMCLEKPYLPSSLIEYIDSLATDGKTRK